VDIVKGNMGWIEVVVGPCFRQERGTDPPPAPRRNCPPARPDFQAAIDERYAANEIISHSGLGIASDNILKASEIMEKCSLAPKSSASTKPNSW